MASPGDTVGCPCGAYIAIPRDGRVPWHKRLGQRSNCLRSGVPAENWDALSVVGEYVLGCPACRSKLHLSRTSAGSAYPLVCDACGTAGPVEEFVVGKVMGEMKLAPKKATGRYVS